MVFSSPLVTASSDRCSLSSGFQNVHVAHPQQLSTDCHLLLVTCRHVPHRKHDSSLLYLRVPIETCMSLKPLLSGGCHGHRGRRGHVCCGHCLTAGFCSVSVNWPQHWQLSRHLLWAVHLDRDRWQRSGPCPQFPLWGEAAGFCALSCPSRTIPGNRQIWPCQQQPSW
jgi:hypothetical protein